MDIIVSLHNNWCQKIFKKEKPFEFRNTIPKNTKENDCIYFYETKKNGGKGKIVGEAKIKRIIPLRNNKGEWPCLGAYHFIDYFFENIKKQKEIAEKFRQSKKFEGKFENYKFGFIINYALSDLELESIRKTGRPINIWKQYPAGYKNAELVQLLKEHEKINECIAECDNWLSSIGFYDECDERKWKYAFELSEIKEYAFPENLSTFCYFKGNKLERIQRAPQSWKYTVGPR